MIATYHTCDLGADELESLIQMVTLLQHVARA
jgi:hypothetical protein